MACAFTPSLLTKRITLQSRSLTGDGQGGFDTEWSDVATVWAQLEPLNGYERMQGMQLASPVSHKALMRYKVGLTTGMRALYQGRVFDIKEVIDDKEQKRWHKLRLVETDKILSGVLWNEQDVNWENIGGTWD